MNIFHINNNFKGWLTMPKTHFKEAVSTAISLSIVSNMAAPVNASELAPATGKFCPCKKLVNSNKFERLYYYTSGP